MRKPFVSLIKNGRYQVGCTGQTVYVLDAAGSELAKFKDMTHAYYAALHPDGEIAAVYSNNGVLAVYSLSELRLMKKFRVSAFNDTKTGTIPCFSPDGRFLYHIEGRKGDSLNSRLTVYSTADYEPVLRLFEKGQKTVFDCMEFDRATGRLFLLGYFRKETGIECFVAKLNGESLGDVRPLDMRTHDFYQSAVYMKLVGYTEEAYKYSKFALMPRAKVDLERLRNHPPYDWGPFERDWTLEDLKRLDPSLPRFWEEAGGR